MVIDYNAVTAASGVAVAAITAIALIVESRRFRHVLHREWLLNSARLVTDFVKEYAHEMVIHRKNLASEILAIRDSKVKLDLTNYFPLLGFFEHIGHLVHRGVLDREMVWNKFFHQVEMYYLALTKPVNYIENARQSENQPMWYVELEWLYHDLAVLDRRKRALRPDKGRPTDIQVSRFLHNEVNIES